MSAPEDDEIDAPEGEEDIESSADDGDIDEEFAGELGEETAPEFDEGDDGDEDLKVVDEALSHKDQGARALAIRRAIEERLEAKRLSQDLDYLDLDLDTDD